MVKFIKALILLFPVSCYAADYGPALEKAKEAAYIQSGLKSNVDKTQKYFENKAYYYAEKIGTERILAASIFSYKVYKDKQITIPISQNKLIINQNSVKVELPL